MTLREIIYDIKEKLKFTTDDIDISDEYIAHLINVKRSFLTKQRFSKFTRNVPEEIKQNICITLGNFNAFEDDECSTKILKSKERLPNFIELGGRSAIISVRTKNRLYNHFNVISIERLPNVGYNKYLKNEIYAALDADQYLYLASGNPQHLIMGQCLIGGVFENPEEADKYACNDPDAEVCDFFDKNYPIDNYIINDIVLLITKELGVTLDIPDDKLNNSDESPRN